MPSAIAPIEVEDVEIEGRRAMTPARKARIHKARDGKCWMCGRPVPESGPDVRYAHRTALELGGSDDDSNIWPLHREPCDRLKTAADQTKIGKVRRLEATRKGRKPPPTRELRSRPFQRRWREQP